MEILNILNYLALYFHQVDGLKSVSLE
jgi:hypothetical protein